jgi:hypothetical protein
MAQTRNGTKLLKNARQKRRKAATKTGKEGPGRDKAPTANRKAVTRSRTP